MTGENEGYAAASKSCVVCEFPTVEGFLNLGHTALANSFISKGGLSGPEARFPLRVGFCHTCGHVQLMEAVPPSAMFEDYLYVSAASETLKDHLRDLSRILVERHRLKADDLVMDIGCNDGTLLQGFQQQGVRTLGVDPAKNLAEISRGLGIDRYIGFFNGKSAHEIVRRWGLAAVITATNTFPHIPELHDFVEGIRFALAPGGAFVIEAHYLVDMIEQGAFDTIYHEHVSYWALRPMTYLFRQHGMQIVNAERIPLHHGQLRVTVQRDGEGEVQPAVAEILEMEHAIGIDRFETYCQFADKARKIKEDLQRTLAQLRAQGKRVAGYGAPAKGNTLLGFLDLGPESIEYIADRSPLKQGLYTPGQHIPVVPPEQLLSDRPDYVLLLAWNFQDEVMRQQAAYREGGGKFITFMPEIRVI